MPIPTLTEAASSAADALHDHADSLPGGDKVARAAHGTAAFLESSAAYLEDMDFREMMADLRQVARRHPGATLLTAGVLGFLLVRRIVR